MIATHLSERLGDQRGRETAEHAAAGQDLCPAQEQPGQERCTVCRDGQGSNGQRGRLEIIKVAQTSAAARALR